jgi:hypothetical protein
MACTKQRINNWTDKIFRKSTVNKSHRVKFCAGYCIFDRRLPDCNCSGGNEGMRVSDDLTTLFGTD